MANLPDERHDVKFAAGFQPYDPFSGEGAAAEARVMAEIERLGLSRNAHELDRNGFTILRPDQVSTPAQVDELRDRIVGIAGRSLGPRETVESGDALSSKSSNLGQVQTDMNLLHEGEVFEQALMNEAQLALITYLLGESCALSHTSSLVKGPGEEYLPLHADQSVTGAPAPYPNFAQVANATWALTDYNAENGALCLVAGSHRLCRAPTMSEATDISLFRPVECPAGSVIIWQGNTWHGAVPRRKPGIRVSLLYYFTRWYYPALENLAGSFSPEVLKRNGERFSLITRQVQPMMDPASPKFGPGRHSLFV